MGAKGSRCGGKDRPARGDLFARSRQRSAPKHASSRSRRVRSRRSMPVQRSPRPHVAANTSAPTLHDGDEIEIKSGRHPVVEAASWGAFIPNDILMNNSTDRLLIITGANMGGKSTILRQVAMHPDTRGRSDRSCPRHPLDLPIIDRIWTRVGASDDLASGRSTFMVEMTETAAILHNATPRSLIFSMRSAEEHRRSTDSRSRGRSPSICTIHPSTRQRRCSRRTTTS